MERSGQFVLLLFQQRPDRTRQRFPWDSHDGVQVDNRVVIESVSLPNGYFAAQASHRAGDRGDRDQLTYRPHFLAREHQDRPRLIESSQQPWETEESFAQRSEASSDELHRHARMLQKAPPESSPHLRPDAPASRREVTVAANGPAAAGRLVATGQLGVVGVPNYTCDMRGRKLSPGIKPLLVLSKIRGILDAFTLAEPALTLAELRSATGYPTSTVQRLVANLVAEGFLDRDGDRYSIGVNFAYWSAAAALRLDLVQLTAPILQRLRDETGETTSLFRVERSFRVCVAMAETRHALRREMHVGKLLPLHAGSSGKVLLAGDKRLEARVLAGPLERFTSATVTDAGELRAQIADARRKGYAISRDERDDGAAGVSVPVHGTEGLLGALAVSAPGSRVTDEMCLSWVDSLVKASEEITRLSGGSA